MGIEIIEVNHVNVTVPAALEEASQHFYRDVLGLKQIEKPDGPRKHIGAWYQLGGIQLHLSIENDAHNHESDRHVCYAVGDLTDAAAKFRNAGVEIISDERPVPGSSRFFVRDPGGNLIEITERPNG
jgi:catechol 2,3-dioxygenase-like lactoylglutathione lyase family enzyme